MDCTLTDRNFSQSADWLNVKIWMNLWILWEIIIATSMYMYCCFIIATSMIYLLQLPITKIELILDFLLYYFNSFYPRLQYTIEIRDNTLNFLDIIIKNDDFLEFDWYHKQSYSGRYLNYFSNHPTSQKRDTFIIKLVDKVLILSDANTT